MYDLSTTTESVVSPGPGGKIRVAISGDLVVWQDGRNGAGDIYAYDLGTATEFRVNLGDTSRHQLHPDVSGDRVVWADVRDTYIWYEIYLRDVTTNTDAGISLANKMTPRTLAGRVGEYEMILFGDELPDDVALEAFDAADAAGVPMLGIGTSQVETPLGYLIDDRFGYSTGTGPSGNAMGIDVTVAGQGHAIFTGIDTSTTVVLEGPGPGEGDEQYYDIKPADPDAPPDWTVLAMLGPDAANNGEDALVEFTTPNGTRVMLDGSANTYDDYFYWNATRWDLLYNQVIYLMGL
jgi:beta propeller repeat protein